MSVHTSRPVFIREMWFFDCSCMGKVGWESVHK